MREARIVDQPDLPPHRCSRCLAGGTSRDFFVDLGFETEFDGVVYLCNICFIDVATTSKLFLTVGDHYKQMAELTLIAEQYDTLTNKMLEWNALFTKLTGNDLYEFFDNLEKVTDGPDSKPAHRNVVNDPGQSTVDEQVIESAGLAVKLNFS
jgi:hypothetical protein